jgi:hypothetical protein
MQHDWGSFPFGLPIQAERSTLMGLRLRMINLAPPSELRKARWSGVGSSVVGADLESLERPFSEVIWGEMVKLSMVKNLVLLGLCKM